MIAPSSSTSRPRSASSRPRRPRRAREIQEPAAHSAPGIEHQHRIHVPIAVIQRDELARRLGGPDAAGRFAIAEQSAAIRSSAVPIDRGTRSVGQLRACRRNVALVAGEGSHPRRRHSAATVTSRETSSQIWNDGERGGISERLSVVAGELRHRRYHLRMQPQLVVIGRDPLRDQAREARDSSWASSSKPTEKVFTVTPRCAPSTRRPRSSPDSARQQAPNRHVAPQPQRGLPRRASSRSSASSSQDARHSCA